MKYYLACIIFISIGITAHAQPGTAYNLHFDSLAKRWDEAMPMGNGWLGALVWQKENKLRLSIDRVDLWDDRPMPSIDKLSFKWVVAQVQKKDYDTVQKIGDDPYEAYPAPTKIPGAALEFDLAALGKVVSNELDIATAVNVIKFDNGTVFTNYIHAVNEIGYFIIENISGNVFPVIDIPRYNSLMKGTTGNSVEGQGLQQLGYARGTVVKTNNTIRYHQPCWSGNYYEVLVQWVTIKNKLTGRWTISYNKKAVLPQNPVAGQAAIRATHLAWWKNYWGKSSVLIPDTLLAKQYYLDMYKFGCVARSTTPPISLQAIWTADNGNLPPWKGDLHHDLNTELSYWPGYSGNHLELTASFTNWLWKVKAQNAKWTKHYFNTGGMNVPGVTTISGKEMGGWIQYSMSPTTAAWIAQHFYWQWKYGMDDKFLHEKCAPYFAGIKTYLSGILEINPVTHQYKLPLSSSPEYNDNSITAWFTNFTNYDLALIKSFNQESAAVNNASANGMTSLKDDKMYPALDTNQTGLTLAPNQNLDESHRHHAHLMAIYPLGLLSPDNSIAQKNIISNSLHWLQQKGTRAWCGYSFGWAACLYARAKEADSAAKMLQIFATNFVSVNSFHLNGDQRGGQYSGFTYRPFTLEGNFAFAQGIQEMLLQSYNGYLEIFPAVPAAWKNVSFVTLRAEGAFLVSAVKDNGQVMRVTITAEAGGKMRLKLPFKTFYLSAQHKKYLVKNNILEINMLKGETIGVRNGFE